jgi:hypothetical protein
MTGVGMIRVRPGSVGDGITGGTDVPVLFILVFTGTCTIVLSGCTQPLHMSRASTSTRIPIVPRIVIREVFPLLILNPEVQYILRLYMGVRDIT